MTPIDEVRLKTADRPEFHHEEQDQQISGETYFKLDYNNVLTSPAPVVKLNGTTKTETTHYVVDYVNGSITFLVAPAVNDALVFEYSSVVFTDEEIQSLLDGAGSSVLLSSARLLYAWAADAARLAYKETRAGGGGIGSITVDTSVRARELRATADALAKQYDQYEGTGEPVELITELPWTRQMDKRMIINDFLDHTDW